jgi:hypothetical protein
MNRLIVGSLIAIPMLISCFPSQALSENISTHSHGSHLIARRHQVCTKHFQGTGRRRHPVTTCRWVG